MNKTYVVWMNKWYSGMNKCHSHLSTKLTREFSIHRMFCPDVLLVVVPGDGLPLTLWRA